MDKTAYLSIRYLFFIWLTVSLALVIHLPASAQAKLDPVKIPRLKPPIQPRQELTMHDSMNETLLRSPRATAIRAYLRVAKSSLFKASEMPNPELWIENGYRAEQTYRLGVALEFEYPWKLITRLLAAKQTVDQMDLNIINQLWQLRGEVRRTYTELVVAQETAEQLIELAELARRLQDVADKRFQAGDVPELDVLKARLATSQAEIEREQGLRRVVEAAQQLNVIMGREPDAPLDVTRLPTFKLKAVKIDLLPDFEKPLPPLKEYIAIAFKSRPDLRLLRQEIKTNKAHFNASVASIIPNTFMNFGNSITGNPPTGPKIKKGYYVEVGAVLPLLNFQQGDLTRFAAVVRQRKMQVKSLENVIESQVARAYQRLLIAREKIRVYQEHVLADSSEVARLARRAYQVGQSDITDTLAAQRANIQVRDEYLRAVLEYGVAFTDLEQAIGRTML